MPSLFNPFGIGEPGGLFGPGLTPDQQYLRDAQQYGSVTGKSTVWTENDVAAAHAAMNEAVNSGTISETQHQYLLGELNSLRMDPASWRDLLDTQVQSFRADRAYEEAEASRQAGIASGRQGLQEYEDFTRPVLQREVDRFAGIFGDPNRGIAAGGLRSDAEFAQFLADQQGAVNAQVQAVNKSASIGNAARGVASSGKVNDQVLKANILGGESRGNLEQGAFEIARQGRDTANDRFSSFLGDLGQRKSAIEAGNFEQGLNLAGYRNPFLGQNFSLGPATTTDLNALNLGNTRADWSLLTTALLGGASAVNQGIGQAKGLFTGG